MCITEVFKLYSEQTNIHTAELQRILLTLRRGGVNTISQLNELYLTKPEELKRMRGIGPKSISLIEHILQFYEIRGPAPPGNSTDT